MLACACAPSGGVRRAPCITASHLSPHRPACPVQLIHIPLKPPEGILEWLDRKGLLSEEDDGAVEGLPGDDAGMLDEEFDLEESDEDTITDASVLDPTDMGATMSDFM
jgi:hypothetical protein